MRFVRASRPASCKQTQKESKQGISPIKKPSLEQAGAGNNFRFQRALAAAKRELPAGVMMQHSKDI